MDRMPRADMVVSKKNKIKRSSTSCCNEITSARSVEAYVIHLCAEIHVFLCGGDCAKRCVNYAKGSKQLRGRARAQLRGNVASNVICIQISHLFEVSTHKGGGGLKRIY